MEKELESSSASAEPESTNIDGTKSTVAKSTTSNKIKHSRIRKTSEASRRSKGTSSRKRVKAESTKGRKSPGASVQRDVNNAKFPRNSVDRALRIPKAIIDQNAGRECTDKDAAKFSGVNFTGPFRVELSSSIKYGFLQRPRAGHISVSDRARQAIRPQNPGDEIAALRDAVLTAPDLSSVYKHYRGENIPDGTFFDNALVDNFNIPEAKLSEFKEVFFTSLKAAQLIEQRGDKQRIIDATNKSDRDDKVIQKIHNGKFTIKLDANSDSCFVIMPFSGSIGTYYQSIYEPAIIKAGLRPIRADADIFGTGKIIDQIWSGINAARVLLAELTTRNPNVFYELGLAHALHKPVVLVSANGDDVPFDLKHIRVIYYDVSDPFWGAKLIDKVAENIVSALKNPDEAVFERALDSE